MVPAVPRWPSGDVTLLFSMTDFPLQVSTLVPSVVAGRRRHYFGW